MPSSDQTESFGASQTERADHVVSPEQYGSRRSSSLKLTPLDMNMPRLYGARWILCFPLLPGADKSQIYDELRIGLSHTIRSIPWLSGSIGPEEGCSVEDNRIQIVDSSDGVKFTCKDLTGTLPSYEELKKQHFPLSSFSTAELGPIGVFPELSQPPVMAAQANFIENGLLLTAGVHHSACDATAFDAIIGTWCHNTAAAGGTGTFTTFDSRSNDRSQLMEGTPGMRVVDCPVYKLPARDRVQPQLTPPANSTLPSMAVQILHFPPESLAELKSSAAAFSTHDALCAFLWRQITVARRGPGGSPHPTGDGETSAFAFAVNIRGRASPPLPLTYLGNASMATMTNRLTVSTLTADSGLPLAAAAIRKSLGAFGSPNYVPLTIGLLQSRPDPTDFHLAYDAFLGPDVVATSWADLKVLDGEWGMLGRPDALRIPGEGADGIVTILPRRRDGGLEVVVGLELEAMGRLLMDDQVIRLTGFTRSS